MSIYILQFWHTLVKKQKPEYMHSGSMAGEGGVGLDEKTGLHYVKWHRTGL